MTIEYDQLVTLITPELNRLRLIFLSFGHDIRFVGGCVRDSMPTHYFNDYADIDLCTNATPDQQIEIYKTYNYKYIETGLQHGTISVVLSDKKDKDGNPIDTTYEITSLRTDHDHDGRHATVEYCRDWEQDAARRDFTINAMSKSFDGRLYDYFGGETDLQAGRVRFVGNPEDRITEDYLRIIRWVRFFLRFDSDAAGLHDLVYNCLEKNQLPKDINYKPSLNIHTQENIAAIEKNVAGLQKISRERVWSEFKKCVSKADRLNDAYTMFFLFYVTGIFDQITTSKTRINFDIKLRQLYNLQRSLYFIGKRPELFISLLVDSPAHLEEFGRDWKWSNQEIKSGKFFAEHIYSGIDIMELALIHKIEYEDLRILRIIREAIQNNKYYPTGTVKEDKTTRYVKLYREFNFPVTGEMLIEFGWKPGPKFGQELADLKKLWYEHIRQSNFNYAIDHSEWIVDQARARYAESIIDS